MKIRLVSLAQAKKLKNKFFPIFYADKSYGNDGKIYNMIDEGDYLIAAPTLSVVQQWLREEKDIEVYCVPYIDETNEKFYYYEIVGYETNRIPYMDYDSALSAGIDNALKIISL